MTGRYPPDDKDDFNVLPKKFHTGGVVAMATRCC